MLLVMGSCRLAEPFVGHAGACLYPGGHVHSSSEFLQAVAIMTGERIPPANLEEHMFRGWGNAPERAIGIDAFDTVALELCSRKSYRLGEWLLHIGYDDNVARGEISALEGVTLYRETYQEIMCNLDAIGRVLSGRRIVIVLQNNLPQLPDRYLLASAAASWAARERQHLVDMTCLIAEHGTKRCLPRHDGDWDYQHLTEYMKKVVREAVLDAAGLASRDCRRRWPAR